MFRGCSRTLKTPNSPPLQPLPSNILYGFLKILILRVKTFKRKELLTILEIWQIFNILRIRDSSFVALLILRHLK